MVGNIYKIKATFSNLYLTLSNDNQIIWEEYENVNYSKQLWKFIKTPAKIHNGVDNDEPINDITAKALNKGHETFVCRYYAIEENNHKILTEEEKNVLKKNNLRIVSFYQDNGSEYESFSAEKGVNNARRAYELATQFGQPAGSAIYFSVDYDPGHNVAHIVKHFEAIKEYLDSCPIKYKIGVYGSGFICNKLKNDEQLADYTFLAQATGWTGFSQYDDPQYYNIKQSQYVKYNGVTFDNDVAVGDEYGQW